MSKAALPGFRDFYPPEFAERAFIARVWREVARRYAFAEYDGPPLEALELYTRKSGDEIVGQLYSFADKGGRDVALRPEMTPTLARMVAARANTLRKPIRWFSIPQLFRYERQQKGRLREHFQLNVDIVGEPDVTADAELLAVAMDIMRAFGLTPADVRARVSDRRLLRGVLEGAGVTDDQMPAVFAVLDKIHRNPRGASEARLGDAGLSAPASERVLGLVRIGSLGELREVLGHSGAAVPGSHADAVAERLADLDRYFEYLSRLGVAEWVTLDLSIVRGLAYYTGIVFELFDAQGEFRAICGGGRYDQLLHALGGVDLPALGFGMGDVVLGELLRARGLMREESVAPQYWVAGKEPELLSDVMEVAAALRRGGASVEYALRAQQLGRQLKAAAAAGVAQMIIVDDRFRGSAEVTVKALDTGGERVCRLDRETGALTANR